MSGPYLGLISGTSADGIDAAIVSFEPFQVLAAKTFAFPEAWRKLTLQLGQGLQRVDLDELGQLDVALGHAFADSALELCERAGVSTSQLKAIGSHGQTIRHRPNLSLPFTLQVGCPHVIAERTGIKVVADFRRRDVAAGGQGAPLVPAFHAAIFPKFSAVLNLGGIANVTVLAEQIVGFDTGPANCLMDAHALAAFGLDKDFGGSIAMRGQVEPTLLRRLLDDPYFSKAAPKSTGREYFNLEWVNARIGELAKVVSPQDLQATLLQLSARSIAAALKLFEISEIWACGGGVHNAALMQAIGDCCNVSVKSTAQLGVDPDFVEAAAFAWLARETLEGRTGNRAEVTGAQGPRVLGAVIG